ncbi:MAG: C25 family cysteine peptidase, partial [bacterium]
DFHHFLSNSINENYVPSYGVPSSDNWFVCFNPDTIALPFMYIGRLPVHDPMQAHHTVRKVIDYDSYSLSEWNKNFLFVAGAGYGPASDAFINDKITPSPIGGTAFRAYKTTTGTIDGEHKARMKEIIRNGVVFLNFIGHSGGRVWEVDIGPPDELENTNGKLPFLASVSCNVGAFSDPISYVLAEDFILADNRGSIASWASSTLGFPFYGNILTRNLLQDVRDSSRAFGPLTTNAKIKMLRDSPWDFLTNTTVKTNNLLGDPASRLAIPLKPDLAITTEQITSNNPTPTPLDSVAQVEVKVLNYGLVPSDSVGVSVTDLFSGATTYLLENKKLPPIRQVDSITIAWRGTGKVGRHVLSATADPGNVIDEVSEFNNSASRDQYVYANVLSISKPLRNTLVLPGPQRLVVTSPVGIDSAGFQYEFQLDTLDTFDSPSLVASGSITPTPVTGEWLTPSLPAGRLYFWRARTVYGQIVGKWVESSFSTSVETPALPYVRWRENAPKQFRRDILRQTASTDSGVTIAPAPAVRLFARSVGSYYNPLAEYYSIIRVNEQHITGYNFDPVSFLVVRLNDFTGSAEFKTFYTSAFPPSLGLNEARKMTAYINDTPPGNYLAFSVVLDGATGVTESLKVAIEQLGSTRIRQLLPYDCWAFIVRKSNGLPQAPPLESYSRTDTAGVFLNVPNYYTNGNGSITSLSLSVPNSWNSFHWQTRNPQASRTRLAFLGIRADGVVDTLRILPQDSSDVDLTSMNSLASAYKSIQMSAMLSTTDAVVTPSLKEWRLDYVPSADLAVSLQALSSSTVDHPGTQDIAVTLYNIGFVRSDSAMVSISVFDINNRPRRLSTFDMPPIQVGASQTVNVPLPLSKLPRRATLQVEVIPGGKDLIAENNVRYYSFVTEAQTADNTLQIFADGTQIMDGDYVATNPTILIRPRKPELVASISLFIDNRLYGDSTFHPFQKNPVAGSVSEFSYHPTLTEGDHIIGLETVQVDDFRALDTLKQTVHVRVQSKTQLMSVVNFPNPFRSETYFTFVLTGSKPVESLSIRIFTVAGRKIRQVDVPSNALKIGFNRVYWDGRDG